MQDFVYFAVCNDGLVICSLCLNTLCISAREMNTGTLSQLWAEDCKAQKTFFKQIYSQYVYFFAYFGKHFVRLSMNENRSQ